MEVQQSMIKLYHGSDHILQVPVYLGARQTTIMEMAFIQLNMRTEPKAGQR